MLLLEPSLIFVKSYARRETKVPAVPASPL